MSELLPEVPPPEVPRPEDLSIVAWYVAVAVLLGAMFAQLLLSISAAREVDE